MERKVENPDRVEPIWARDLTSKDLRLLCRTKEVSGYSGMTRKQMIDACTPRKDAYKKCKLYSAIDPKEIDKYSEEEAMNCSAKGIIKSERERLSSGYDKLKCKPPRLRPSVDNDSFNDCPLFYRLSDDKCCAPSAKAKLKAVFRTPRISMMLYDHFVESMNIVSTSELFRQLSITELNKDEKEKLILEHKSGEDSLKEWFKERNLDQKSYLFILTLGKAIKDRFYRDFERTMRELQETGKGDGKSTKDKQEKLEKDIRDEENIFLSLVKKIGNAIGYAASKLVKLIYLVVKEIAIKGFDLLKFIFSNPHTARIMAYIALRIKKRLCREISIELGKIKYVNEKTLGESAKDAAVSAINTAKEGLPNLISNFVNSSKFDTMWDTMASGVSSGIGSVISAVPYLSKSVPVVGGVIELASQLAKDSARFTIEVAMYEEDVSGTFKHLIDLIDIGDCVKETEVTREELSNRRGMRQRLAEIYG